MNKNLIYVIRYGKTDHSQFFLKIVIRVWIDADFTVEFNGQSAMEALKSFLSGVMAKKLYTGHQCLSSQFFEKRSIFYLHNSTFNVSVYAPYYTTQFAP